MSGLPRGAEIRHGDGTVTRCALRRDDDDPDGQFGLWVAVAPPGTVIGRGDTFSIDLIPDGVEVALSILMREDSPA
jgi:hypothetical protein